MRLKQGDTVRYIGLDSKVQRDYGHQDLVVFKVDAVSAIAVCKNRAGNLLVGIRFHELQLTQKPVSAIDPSPLRVVRVPAY